MKRMILAAAAALFATGANAMMAQDLARDCKSSITLAGNYVMGFMEKWREDEIVFDSVVKMGMKDEQMLGIARESILGKFCIPKGANVARAIVIGCDWVTTHPEKGTWPAERSLMAPYKAAWPCDQ
ncbi:MULTISPECIES: Rap1a/Tai family immunity protein [Rhizobium]|uniref:Rap1a immunity protein domain-containing protein n=3 Tax=Rhizobium TaxID=379 RepID=A0A6P1CBN3_RHITR|nr:MULTISPECIES: Rap1a/Tai family immunity protein [Rhizobium]AGB73322.1 hypothetical protein RTCIAT899_PB00040 [Rhizobium tropici CIAT 899]ENN86623.1 hypothetical protein RHSP_18902 [Rhizobium freirei PRF 81]MBB4244623.1 hypothetical protein [Rhizobium tropici]MBB5595966.1 hypothetical protein [Rhizobium tropici]MBB6305399.1 hypothetical protein [Rhizobium leucaenae]